jgi:hypothetical protein
MQLTKDDVFGKIAEDENGFPYRATEGMVVGQQKTTCPIWGDEIPYKSTTVVCEAHQVDDVIYWMIHVKGGDCISRQKTLPDGKVALRGDYQCW